MIGVTKNGSSVKLTTSAETIQKRNPTKLKGGTPVWSQRLDETSKDKRFIEIEGVNLCKAD